MGKGKETCLSYTISGSVGKSSISNTGDPGSIPGSGRYPGGGHDKPFHYSFLENPMDRGAWQAIVHRVTKSHTRLKQLSTAQHIEKVINNLLDKMTYSLDVS